MKNLIFILAVLPSFALAAKPASVKKESPYTIVLMQTGANKAAYKKAFPEADVYTLDDVEKINRREVLPFDQQKDLFEKAGLTDKVKHMDIFDRDMFVRYMRNFDAGFVAKKYKNIPLQNIEVAQRMLKQN